MQLDPKGLEAAYSAVGKSAGAWMREEIGDAITAYLSAAAPASLPEDVAGLVERLSVKADIMETGEPVAWGSDTALMREAAALITTLSAARDADKARIAEVANMTNSQTEARAIVGEVTLDAFEKTKLVDLIAAALAAKEAELAEAKEQLQRQFDQTVRFQGYLVDAKAQLAEANKALEPFAAEADEWADDVPDGYHPGVTEPGYDQAHASAKFNLGHLRAARRAREAQGGSNA